MKSLLRSISTITIILFTVTFSFGQTSISGDITTNTTWTAAGSPYTITTTILVEPGVSLTIEPGVEVLFDSGTSLLVDGAIIADGTEGDKILFTSSSGTPVPGDWETIRFNSTANVGSVMDHVILEYGGSGSGGSLVSYKTGAYGFDISNSEFRYSNAHGIDLRASSPAINNSIFRDNGGYGVFSDLALNFSVDSSIVKNNSQGGIRVPINSTPTIHASIIEANGTGIYVDNGAIPEITFNDIIDNATGIRVIEAGSVSPVITDNTISGNTTIGMRNDGSGLLTAEYNFWGDKSGPANSANPSGTGDEVTYNIDYTPWLYGATLPVREITSNPQHGDIWYADSVYFVTQNLTIPTNYTLTIQPGAVVKFADNLSMTVHGTLIADGTEEDKIFFTSQYDDGVGGDSNGDARETQPDRGNWRRLLIQSGSENSVLNYVDLRFGGYSNGLLYLNSNSVSVTNVLVTNSNHHGIYINSKPLAFNNITSNSNRYDGIYVHAPGSELNNLTTNYNGSGGLVVRLDQLSENVSIDNLISTNNNYNGIHFNSGGSDRLYGLTFLTNSTLSNNNQNGLRVDENGVDQLSVSDNIFESNGEYGASLFLNDADENDVVIHSNTFSNNNLAGLRTSAATIYDNHFEDNEFGLTLWGQLGHVYNNGSGVDNNSFVENKFNNVLGLEGYYLKGNLSIQFPEVITSRTYMFQRFYVYGYSSAAVASNDTLVIEPGVIIKSGYSGYSSNYFGANDGMIIAEGTDEEPIIFTSWRDDSIGGDTDAIDDTVSARPNDWGGLYIYDYRNDNSGVAKFSRLSNLIIKYAHRGLSMEMGNQLLADELDNLTISQSNDNGMYLHYGRYTITNSLVEEARYQGVNAYYNADVTVRNSTIRNNGHNGLYAYGVQGSFYREVSNSVIENNGHHGIFNADLQFSSTILGNVINNNGNTGVYYYYTELDETDVYYTGNTISNNVNSGIVSPAAVFIDNHFEGNELGITLHGKLGHRYTDENGDDGNTFVDNTFNNVLGLEGYYLKGTLNTVFPEAITSGAYMFQRVYIYSTGSAAVAANDTLVIEPGVIIKSGYGGSGSNYFGTNDGMIIAEGTDEKPIIFTSWRDDSFGGDTDAIDDTVSARPNDWGGLYINDYRNDNSGVAKFSRLSNVVVKYAFRGLSMEMGNQFFSDEIDNITISYSYNDGMYLNYGRYTVTHSLIENTQRYQGITAYTNADVTVRNSTIRNSGENGLHTYNRSNYYSFFREVSNSIIENNGHDGIHAINSTSPMTYQSNTIQNNARNGIWATITEAGTDTVLTISGNNIRNNVNAGILSSRAIIVDDTLEYNGYPIGVTGELSKAGTINDQGNYYEGNYIANNKIDSVTAVYGIIKGVVGGTRPDGYLQNVLVSTGNNSDITLNAGDSLIVVPGSVFKSFPSTDINIKGTLLSQGEAENKIVFTSFADDTFGGDTNRDTTDVVPAPNGWSGINISGAGSDSTRIKNTIVRYAYHNLELNDTEAVIDSSAFSYAQHDGIRISSGANPIIRSTDLHHNKYGIAVHSNSTPALQFNNFYANTENGLYQNAGTNIIAENNYWGHESGPFIDQGSDQNLQGEGNRIFLQNGTVDYRPYLTGRNGILLGDVTENGTISAFDASTVLQHIVGAATLEGNALAAADVSANGTVSAMDASYILQFVVGNISGFPGQGKRVTPEYEKAITLDYHEGSAFTDIELQSTGEATIYSAEMNIAIPENHIEKVKYENSESDVSLNFEYSIEADTIRIALASASAIQDKANLGAIRLIHKDDTEVENTTDRITFDKFWLNEADITDHINANYTSNENLSDLPTVFDLKQNYPNPFNPTTNIAYDLPQGGEVTLKIYNMLGQLVQTIVNKRQKAGAYTVKWDAAQFGSGAYLLRIDFDGDDKNSYSQVRKMLLIK